MKVKCPICQKEGYEIKDGPHFLRTLRISKNCTLKELQDATGIPNARYSQWENGKRSSKRIPHAEDLQQLSFFFGVKIDVFLKVYGYLKDEI